MEPLLRWTGSKRWQVEQLRPTWAKRGEGRRLVELFAGSAAITFGLEPERALLVDANPHLMNLYRHVRHGLRYELETTHENYYAYRAWFNDLLKAGHAGSGIAAQLFYYLNVHGFNNLWRVNAKGEFNVPVRPGERRMCVPDFKAYGRFLLTRCQLETSDFGVAYRHLVLDSDFVYADPPYDGTFSKYTDAGFSWEDQERLACMLAQHEGPVVLMNAATERVLDLYKSLGYVLNVAQSGQRMHHLTASVDAVKEVIATNFVL